MAGYPGRHSYDQFYKRYRIVEPSAGSGASDAQTATKALVAALKLGPGQYQFGLTKLFLKGGEVWSHTHTHTLVNAQPRVISQLARLRSCQIAILERKRGEKLSDAAVTMQKTWRRFKARKHLRRLKESLVRMQSCTFPRSWVQAEPLNADAIRVAVYSCADGVGQEAARRPATTESGHQHTEGPSLLARTHTVHEAEEGSHLRSARVQSQEREEVRARARSPAH
jgi:hypothetical protein